MKRRLVTKSSLRRQLPTRSDHDSMPDVLNEEQRRFNMSRVRGRDTKPELAIRRGLHARGLRFRLYHKNLPGRPDLVFPGHRAVVFVHGCFWHGHDCRMFVWPKTRTLFWQEKIGKTRNRDQSTLKILRDRGWRVLTVWECALRGPARCRIDDLLIRCEDFVLNPAHDEMTIRGGLPSTNRST